MSHTIGMKKKEITIISGKGGVGKTTVSSSLLYLMNRDGLGVVAADADVDTPSLHLAMGFRPIEERNLTLSSKAKIGNKCILCGRCVEKCPFGAIVMNERPRVIPYMCDGCSICLKACPVGAISLEPAVAGKLVVGESRYGFPMVTAQLNVGEHNSGLLVNEVRKKALEICNSTGREFVVTDGAPGIGCPVIASLSATDYALVVTEPTPEALQGAERILEITTHFGVPAGVVLNKHDMSDFGEEMLRKFESSKIEVLGKIPLDFSVVESLSNAEPVVAYRPDSPAARSLFDLYERLREVVLP